VSWGEVFLGVIAVATLGTAIAQLGVLVTVSRLGRRVERLTDQVERELKPIVEHWNVIGRDVSRTTSLATAQLERVDRVLAGLVERLDRTLDGVQAVVSKPVREGGAVLSAFLVALKLIRREMRARRARSRTEEDEALFI
jgi:hypothetical protein